MRTIRVLSRQLYSGSERNRIRCLVSHRFQPRAVNDLLRIAQAADYFALSSFLFFLLTYFFRGLFRSTSKADPRRGRPPFRATARLRNEQVVASKFLSTVLADRLFSNAPIRRLDGTHRDFHPVDGPLISYPTRPLFGTALFPNVLSSSHGFRALALADAKSSSETTSIDGAPGFVLSRIFSAHPSQSHPPERRRGASPLLCTGVGTIRRFIRGVISVRRWCEKNPWL